MTERARIEDRGSKSNQQTLVQSQPRGERGARGKTIITALPVIPVSPVVEIVYQCYLLRFRIEGRRQKVMNFDPRSSTLIRLEGRPLDRLSSPAAQESNTRAATRI